MKSVELLTWPSADPASVMFAMIEVGNSYPSVKRVWNALTAIGSRPEHQRSASTAWQPAASRWLRPLARVRTQFQPLYQSVTCDRYCVRANRMSPSHPSVRSQRTNFKYGLNRSSNETIVRTRARRTASRIRISSSASSPVGFSRSRCLPAAAAATASSACR